MRGRSVTVDVDTDVEEQNNLNPTLTCTPETWTWNGAQRGRMQAVEMSSVRGACGATSWNKDTNESVNERCGMSGKDKGVSCGVGEWKRTQVDVWKERIKVISDRKVYES